MDEAAKDEFPTWQNAESEVSHGLQHIYSTLARSREAGEDEYGPKSEKVEEFGETVTDNQSSLGDNRGNESGVTGTNTHDMSKRLTDLSLEPTGTVLRSRKDRIEVLKQQALGRKRRNKENIAGSGLEQDTESESESDKKHTKPKRKTKNVLTRMEAVTGPLSLLYKSVSERLKVKVWIRSASSIRGICTGYILAFDTHFNLVMADVDEVYKPAGNPNPCQKKKVRKKKKKVKAETMKDSENTMEDVAEDKEDNPETIMDVSDTTSGKLRSEHQLDGAADSSDSESETNSATTHRSDENDSTEGDDEEDSDPSTDNEEDLEELMAKLDKLKHEYEHLKTGETPVKHSPKDTLSPYKEGEGATAVVETRSEESSGCRRSQRLQSQTTPMEIGSGQAKVKTSRSSRRDQEDPVKSSSSKMKKDSTKHRGKEREDLANTAKVDQQKSARLESMIANLKETEQNPDTPPTDLRTKLRLIRESKSELSRTQTKERDKTPSRKIRSHVSVIEHRRKDYRSSESESDSEEDRESRKPHSSGYARDRDDRSRRWSPHRDTHRDRHKDSGKEWKHKERKEYEKRKESPRSREYEEHDRHRKHELHKEHDRAKDHERKREHEKHRDSERHHSHRALSEGHKEHIREKEYGRQRAYERQKDQERQQEGGKVPDSKRTERGEQGNIRDNETLKSRESHKNYDEYKVPEGYSRRRDHSDLERHRNIDHSDDKHMTLPKDDAHKSSIKGRRSTRFEKHQTNAQGNENKELRSEGDNSNLSKYLRDNKLASASKPVFKQGVLVGDRVPPRRGAKSMNQSILSQLRGTSLGDAGLYQRHVKQMMIRGDNVVMVSIVP